MSSTMELIRNLQLKKLCAICLLNSILVSTLTACNSGSTTQQTPTPTITSFSINGVPGIITSYGTNSKTTDYSIMLQLPESTILNDLVPVFSLSTNASGVSVNGTPNYSGISHNNFDQPLVYTVSGTTPNNLTTYTVAVNYGTLTSNITESTYYSLTTGLSSEVIVSLTGAYAANGKRLITRQEYLYGDEQFLGSPVQKLIQLGMAKDNPTQPPIGEPFKNVAIAALLLFLPTIIDICPGASVESCVTSTFYYPPLEYKIPVVP